MEISPRKPPKRKQELVDEWLQSEGYFRKHAPRDSTCLFRAISEQVYSTQYYHIRVRKECVEFMRKTRHLFEENYLEQMACFTEWGGMNEIQAMSLLYQREVVIFDGGKLTLRNVTNNSFRDTIRLCYTLQKQYESVYTKDQIATAGFCQSIMYKVLYENVFNMPKVEDTVNKMLHGRNISFRHDKFFQKKNLEIRDELTAEIFEKIENDPEELDDMLFLKDIPPFPYKVAKALDPNIYRNTDFDIWNEIRREVKNAGWTRSNELQIGGKCLVQVNINDEDSADVVNNNVSYTKDIMKDSNRNEEKAIQRKSNEEPIFSYGYIQEITKNDGPVLVFIEELGEKRSVPYSALKPLPLRGTKQNTMFPLCRRSSTIDPNQKWRKPCGNNTRKIKELMNNANNTERNSDNNNNDISSINGNFETNYWNDESCKTDGNHIVDKSTAYQANRSIEIISVPVVFESSRSTVETSGEYRENNLTFGKHNVEGNIIPKTSKSLPNDSNSQVIQHPKSGIRKDISYSPYPENSQFRTFPYNSESSGEQMLGNQVDRILRSVNYSATKSIDTAGSDLPFSDLITLRFFYNLGIESFRANHAWGYQPNGHPHTFGPWYPNTQPTGPPPVANNVIPSTSQIEEEINGTTGLVQSCAITPAFKGDADNVKKGISSQQNSTCVKNVQEPAEPRKAEKDAFQCAREKPREQPSSAKDLRTSKDTLAPRFKKNFDNRYREYHQKNHEFQRSGAFCQNSSNQQDVKAEGPHGQANNSMQLHPPMVPQKPYHPPFLHQTMYAGMPFYRNDGEPFGNPCYVPNTGFFPVPCIPHSDIPDGNNIHSYPHIYPGVETYAQTYPPPCPPFVYSQPTVYSVSSVQNVQEHWYALPEHSHFLPCAPMQPPVAESCNATGLNAGQSTTL